MAMGRADLVIVNANSQTLTVLRRNVNGFDTPVTLRSGSLPTILRWLI